MDWEEAAKKMYFWNGTNPNYDVYMYMDIDDERLPHELCDRLIQIDNLCRLAGGRLKSRQVIAMVVAQYLKEFPYETTED